MATITGFAAMPIRSVRGTPQWEETDPNRDSAERYFEDLERLFAQHQVTTDLDKKKSVLQYVPTRVARLWRSLPEYETGVPGATYEDFKKTILDLYLGIDSTRPWTIQDYNAIIGTYARSGITTLSDYMQFYGEAYPIAQYLTTRSPPDLTKREVAATFQRLISQTLQDAIILRLRQKVPDKHVADGYTIEQMHEAIQYAFMDAGAYGAGAPSAALATTTPARAAAAENAATQPPSNGVKVEGAKARRRSARHASQEQATRTSSVSSVLSAFSPVQRKG